MAAAAFLRELANVEGFDRQVVAAVDTTSVVADAGSGEFRCDMRVTKDLANRYKTCHGGCLATVVDTFGTAALATCSKSLGVSLDLNVSYMKGVPLGSTLHVAARVLMQSRAVAVIQVDIDATANEKRYRAATGRHTKYLNAKVESALAGTSKL